MPKAAEDTFIGSEAKKSVELEKPTEVPAKMKKCSYHGKSEGRLLRKIKNKSAKKAERRSESSKLTQPTLNVETDATNTDASLNSNGDLGVSCKIEPIQEAVLIQGTKK